MKPPGTQRSTSEPRRRRDSGKPAGELSEPRAIRCGGHGRRAHQRVTGASSVAISSLSIATRSYGSVGLVMEYSNTPSRSGNCCVTTYIAEVGKCSHAALCRCTVCPTSNVCGIATPTLRSPLPKGNIAQWSGRNCPILLTSSCRTPAHAPAPGLRHGTVTQGSPLAAERISEFAAAPHAEREQSGLKKGSMDSAGERRWPFPQWRLGSGPDSLPI